MIQARLIELGIVSLNLIVLAIAIVVGMQVSIWAGLLVFVLMAFGLLSLIYNFDYWLVRRLSTPDDPLLFNLCKSGFIGRTRRWLRYLPASPRCRICLVPFGGIGKLIGIRPTTKNPNFCRSCFEGLPTKTHQLKVGVLFADIRGFTSWTERHSSSDVTEYITQFYKIANQVITADDAFVDFIGDQIMAVYVVGLPSLGERTADIMVAAAKRLVKTLKEEEKSLPVGIGMSIGEAQVGALVMGESRGFTAVGDVVNTAARLQSIAGEYEIVLSDDVYAAISEDVPEANPTTVELKGKVEPQKVHVISAAD